MNVVAATEAIEDPHDRGRIDRQVRFRHERFGELAEDRHASQAAADVEAVADLARLVAIEMNRDVVGAARRAIAGRAGARALDLARQPQEYRLQRLLLAPQSAVRTEVRLGGKEYVTTGR